MKKKVGDCPHSPFKYHCNDCDRLCCEACKGATCKEHNVMDINPNSEPERIEAKAEPRIIEDEKKSSEEGKRAERLIKLIKLSATFEAQCEGIKNEFEVQDKKYAPFKDAVWEYELWKKEVESKMNANLQQLAEKKRRFDTDSEEKELMDNIFEQNWKQWNTELDKYSKNLMRCRDETMLKYIEKEKVIDTIETDPKPDLLKNKLKLLQQLTEIDRMNKRVIDNYKDERAKLIDAQNELHKIQNECLKCKKEYQGVNSKLMKLKVECDAQLFAKISIEDQLTQLNNTITIESTKLANKKQKYLKYENTCVSLKEKKKALEEDGKTLIIENTGYRAKNSELEASIAKLLSEKQDAETCLLESKKDITKAKEEATIYITKQKTAKLYYEKEIAQLDNNKNELESYLIKKQNEKIDLLKDLEKIKGISSNLERESKELENKNEKLHDELKKKKDKEKGIASICNLLQAKAKMIKDSILETKRTRDSINFSGDIKAMYESSNNCANSEKSLIDLYSKYGAACKALQATLKSKEKKIKKIELDTQDDKEIACNGVQEPEVKIAEILKAKDSPKEEKKDVDSLHKPAEIESTAVKKDVPFIQVEMKTASDLLVVCKVTLNAEPKDYLHTFFSLYPKVFFEKLTVRISSDKKLFSNFTPYKETPIIKDLVITNCYLKDSSEAISTIKGDVTLINCFEDQTALAVFVDNIIKNTERPLKKLAIMRTSWSETTLKKFLPVSTALPIPMIIGLDSSFKTSPLIKQIRQKSNLEIEFQ